MAQEDKADAGYAKELKPRHIRMIAIGGSIGTGLFLGTGGRLAQGGPGLMIAYAICGVFAFLMVRALGELAIRRPSSGAIVSYAREFFGEKGAYFTGWLYYIVWATVLMADSTASALYLKYWSVFDAVPQWVLAFAVLAVVFVINMLSVKMFGEAEFWFSAIKVAMIMLFIVVGIWAACTGAHVGDYTAGIHNITDNGGLFPQGMGVVLTLTLGVIYAFGGTEMVGVASGEAKDAQKVLPHAINSMIFRILVFYVGSVAVMTLVMPYTAYSANESPFVTFFAGLGVPHAGDVVQFVVLTAALSALNSGLYASGRTLRSLALAGSAPKVARKLSKHKVPSGAIPMTMCVALIGVVLNAIVPSAAFNIVMNLAGIGIATVWCLIMVIHLAFMRRVRKGLEPRPAYHLLGAPVTDWVTLVFFVVVVFSNFFTVEGRQTIAVFAVVVVALIIGWFAVRGRINGTMLDNMLDINDDALGVPDEERAVESPDMGDDERVPLIK
ncbi:amino acid permease [Pseudoscardovia suis]|uniref:amino acid permease n=1 Tax=Pseudoscardovia suis TaxID=987063 RepID=UPI003F95362A